MQQGYCKIKCYPMILCSISSADHHLSEDQDCLGAHSSSIYWPSCWIKPHKCYIHGTQKVNLTQHWPLSNKKKDITKKAA